MGEAPSIAFVTLGCAKNEVDSDKMRAHLAAAGFSISDRVTDADLVIVNTCAFLQTAVEESLEVIFDLAVPSGAGDRPSKVLVAGCVPSRYGSELSDELTEAAGFLPAGEEEHVVEAVERILGCEAPGHQDSGAALRFENPVSAYVKISDGCDRFCSYCMIPHIRGRYYSYAFEDIDAEVAELVECGVREIVLIGQDTGIWGRDLADPSTTSRLLATLAQSYPNTWFRILYLQPQGITDELLDVMARYDNVCSYLDIPLQHSDRCVLARMNRDGDASSYLDLVRRIRAHVPGVMLRTTFMAGFPGETRGQFDSLLEFAEEAAFDYAGVFAFSAEEGSAAYDFDEQLDPDECMARAQELLDVCEMIGTARVSRLVGSTLPVLVEGYEQTDVGLEALCRTQGQAPEVDGQVHVPVESADVLEPGRIVDVEITGSFHYELEGIVSAGE